MSSTVIKRLLWKEARTLLPIWGTLLIAVAAIQLALLVAGLLGTGASASPGSGFLSWTTLCSIVGPLAFCFAAAAAGIQFAGETEERTDDWLRVLPIPPGLLTACKLGTALVALLLFVGLGTALGLLFTVLFAQVHPLRELREADAGSVFGMTLISGLLALATGLFLSVRMKRVVSVVAGSLILTLPLLGLSDWFVKDVLRIPSDAGSPTVFCLLGLLDVWLVWRWCRGESVALPRPTVRIDSVAAWLTPSQSFGLARLQQAASIGQPWTRVFAVQVWREVRSAIPFTLVWGGAGLIFLLPTLLGSTRSFPVEVGTIFAMIYWLATPGVTGLMTAGSEQRHNQPLFLGQRGVPTSATWLAKQLVWLSVAVLLVVGWTAAQYGLAEKDTTKLSGGRTDFPYALSVTEEISHLGKTRLGLSDVEATALRRDFLLSLGLSLYALGQICGFWFHNLFVGGAVATFLTFLVGLWHYIVVSMDVPLHMACGPLVVLWLLATWRLLDAWQTGQFISGLRLRRLAWLIGPCLVAMVMFSYARATQIPDVEFHEHLSKELASIPVAPELTVAEVNEWEDWTASLRQYVDFMIVHSGPTGKVRKNLPPGVIAPDPGPFDARLKKLVSDLRSGRSEVLPLSSWTSPISYGQLGDYMHSRAFQLSHAGEQERALQMYVDGLCILRCAARLQPAAIKPAMSARRNLLSSLAEWVRHEARTSAELQKLLDDKDFISETTLGWWSPPEVIAQQYANTVQNLIDRHGTDFDMLMAKVGIANPQAQLGTKLLNLLSWLNGNDERTRRLLKVLTVDATAIALWNRPLVEFSEYSQADFERWVATTQPMALSPPGGYLRAPTVQLQNAVLAGQIDIACQNAVRLLIALEIHRIEQGQYPESLSKLVPKFFRNLPTDPFTGEDFVYHARGLDSLCLLDNPDSLSRSDSWRRLTLQGRVTGRGNEAVTFLSRNSGLLGNVSTDGNYIPIRQPLLFSRGPSEGGLAFQSLLPQPIHQHATIGFPEVKQFRPASDERPVVPGFSYDNAPNGTYWEVRNGSRVGNWKRDDIFKLLNAPPIDPSTPAAFVVLGCDFPPWGTEGITTTRDKVMPDDLPEGD
ncbi:MAG: hypothetical protein ACK5Q5_09455 [Planctomycetaceae bacterium]